MLHQQFGVVNYILYQLGFTDTVNISWTMQPVNAMASVIIAAVWRQLPYMMVMLLAGLQSVDKSLVESATIDGASPLKTLLYVRLGNFTGGYKFCMDCRYDKFSNVYHY